jgi:hypothetical protein
LIVDSAPSTGAKFDSTAHHIEAFRPAWSQELAGRSVTPYTPDHGTDRIRNVADYEAAFAAAGAEQADALMMSGGIHIRNHVRIVRLAVRDGGLMAYGANPQDLHRRAATYVDKVLEGANPADLPVEQPTTFDFVINLKTAQALGLTIPEQVLLQATEVLQQGPAR